ncbi:hypothetical protein EJ05DRAFT_305774 [Pseudovirgaria hyperparasitica]|uniref:Uncharacterized protein n=1 Tax=Pseudovirgaria hyperparasitica TaxID=470096 RepID=A0A6A6WEX1_9PEZI|nr:uncharacterized protein EJ05DRAFT_305774 [Pseudovirgaria hyperparasitica]KAF2759661.1 hypothetical protein EJ05DRAFT_305774 [Pseudovirgaria hyperparasitica]
MGGRGEGSPPRDAPEPTRTPQNPPKSIITSSQLICPSQRPPSLNCCHCPPIDPILPSNPAAASPALPCLFTPPPPLKRLERERERDQAGLLDAHETSIQLFHFTAQPLTARNLLASHKVTAH